MSIDGELSGSNDINGLVSNALTAYQIRNMARSMRVISISASNSYYQDADYVCDGTDDHIQIQAAIDEAAGLSPNEETILLLPGTYTLGNTQANRILKRTNVSIRGYGATITIPNGCDDYSPTLIECEAGNHNWSYIAGITGNGNSDNNTIVNFPAGAHGLFTAEWDYSGGGFVASTDDKLTGTAERVMVFDTHFHHTGRCCYNAIGKDFRFYNSTSGLSKYDHGIYICSGQKIYFKDTYFENYGISPVSIWKAGALHSTLNCVDIVFDGVYLDVDFQFNGATPLFHIFGGVSEYIKNISIKNVIIDGTLGNLQSNRLEIIKGKYINNLYCEVFLRNKLVQGTEKMFNIELCEGIKIKLFVDVDTGAATTIPSMFYVKDSDNIDLSDSYVNIRDNTSGQFLELDGDCNNINLQNCVYKNTNGILIKDGGIAAGNRYNIKIDGIYFNGSDILNDTNAQLIMNNKIIIEGNVGSNQNVLIDNS